MPERVEPVDAAVNVTWAPESRVATISLPETTDSLVVAEIAIESPALYEPLAVDDAKTEIVGRTPSTMCDGLAATAEWVMVALAATESRIVPPFRPSAFAAIDSPPLATSPSATVYEKTNVVDPVPDEYVAYFDVRPPRSTRGVLVTSTDSENVTETSTVSPMP